MKFIVIEEDVLINVEELVSVAFEEMLDGTPDKSGIVYEAAIHIELKNGDYRTYKSTDFGSLHSDFEGIKLGLIGEGRKENTTTENSDVIKHINNDTNKIEVEFLGNKVSISPESLDIQVPQKQDQTSD